MKRIVGTAAALLAAALIGGTLIGSALAASPEPSASPDAVAATQPVAVGKYCETFRAAFAAELGVDEAAIQSAARAAATKTIDAAVAAGDISTDRGDRLKARVSAAQGDACRWYGGVIRRASGAVHAFEDAGTAAAGALNMTAAELRTALRDGNTLRDLAQSRNVPYDTVTAAVVAAVKADLDAAVAKGTIRQARADRILERLERALANGLLRPARSVGPSGG